MFFKVVFFLAAAFIGCQAEDCGVESEYRERCKGLLDACPEGLRQKDISIQGAWPECWCVREYTAEERAAKRACECNGYLDTCQNTPGALASCGFAVATCTPLRLQEVCGSIVDHESEIYGQLCKPSLDDVKKLCGETTKQTCRAVLVYSKNPLRYYRCTKAASAYCANISAVEDLLNFNFTFE